MTDATQHKSTQLERVFAALKCGAWFTLGELHAATGDPISSVSAQIRHLRKEQYGSHRILKRRRGASERGLFEYRLVEAATGEI